MIDKDDKIILVIEDEIPLQEAIKRKLDDHSFKVVTARKVEQALNLLLELERVDVIWLDHYLLGEKNGLDFIIEVKNNKKWKKIPVFVVSNTASADKVKSYISFGVDKYYVKADFKLGDIIEDIKKQLKSVD
ncbi:response regulator [bacterium]|nr:response regulator [bacterium]